MIKNVVWILTVIASSVAMAGDPALPGHHPLSQIQAGSLLLAELRCAACHSGVPRDSLIEKIAPDLTDVGARVTPEFLRNYIASPATAHPGTTMPDMLASKSESEKQDIAESLTHFLISQSRSANPGAIAEPIDRQQGYELFHSIGCVACHGPQETPKAPEPSVDEEPEEDLDPAKAARKAIKPSAIALSHVSAKYTVHSLSEFLFQPLKVRSSGRMPDMKLTPTEALAIAGYLVGEQKPASKSLVPKAELVQAGKEHFRALNCNACHSLPGFEAATAVSSLKSANLNAGCLATLSEGTADSKVRGRSPRFVLDANQVSAVAAAVRADQVVESDKEVLAKTLTALRCINCHVRDDYGGVHDAHNAFFKGSQLILGDDGRIPPPLTWMGAKLQSAWMKKVLFDGESVRHYMATRMPQYGENNLSHLPELFSRLDTLTGPEMKLPKPESRSEEERQREKLIRAAGRELLGDKGANCVACHKFNGKAAITNQGIDLLTSTERLQPAWFHSYLRNPGAFRPRTVMPTAWPGGVAAFTNILDGDTNRQIEAIWYYLSLGTSAADPSGVRAVGTKLVVGDTAVIHRGRSRVAGFRGIAVGLPEKLSYAFNAETGTLSAIWEGEFVSVNWSGQGSGDFNPANQSIQLAQDVSFAALEDDNAPWPLLPVMTKEAPANPNPLYPKNVGYQFRGYFLDKLFIPTFQYRSGNLEIEDRTVAIGGDGNRMLQRVLKFDSPLPQTIWFRAFVGDIRQESDQVFRDDRMRLSIPPSETRLRLLSDEPKRLELLLRLQIPQGISSLEVQYEPLKK
ncbi:MAG: c-type cytochrome [Pirellulaceae bacterium]|nr:c-type cytochrome [Pirellulaceae bacterium]